MLDLIHTGIGIGVGTLDWERENPLEPPQKRIFFEPHCHGTIRRDQARRNVPIQV
jgi:hypothetical protein